MKNDLPLPAYQNQHLINPENCLRCATCERTCAAGAISHDSNFVIDPEKCTACLECLAACPTGAIDHWRIVPRAAAYTLAEQHGWQRLPQALGIPAALVDPAWTAPRSPRDHARRAPASAPLPQLNRYTVEAPAEVVVRCNQRIVTAADGSDVHHLVFDCGDSGLRLVEGQTIGVIPPGTDAAGQACIPRLYSIASARDGESGTGGDFALTVKRVVRDRDGRAVTGVASNHLCDLPVGATVRLTGPYGGCFLMPDDPAARLLMIATGTGIAPMRAMIRRRLHLGELDGTRAVLFYGGRTPDEMPYHRELAELAPARLTLHAACSRLPGQPRRYVQHALIEQRAQVAELLADPCCHLFLCGRRDMEQEVMACLQRIAGAARLDWATLREDMQHSGRLHIETY